jgi:hypothetical protein
MNVLAAKALEIVRANTNTNYNVNYSTNHNNACTTEPLPTAKQNLNYKDLCLYIRLMDLKGVVDVFGDVRNDKYAAHKLAEYSIARWDMTPGIYEYVKQYLISPLRYPIIYDKPTGENVYAEDFENEWQFKKYCEYVELKIKTKEGWIMKAPYVDAPLKISGAMAFLYANRHKNAKFASPLKLHSPSDVFDKISHYFHTHNLDIVKHCGAFKFEAKTIKYIDNHFEICTLGEGCTINKVVRVILNSNPSFAVPATLKLKFEMITGRTRAQRNNNLKTITNVPGSTTEIQDGEIDYQSKQGKRRGKNQQKVIAGEA